MPSITKPGFKPFLQGLIRGSTNENVHIFLYRVFPENGFLVYSGMDRKCWLKDCTPKQPFLWHQLYMLWVFSQLSSYKRYLECTHMETIYLSLVHTGSWGTVFMKSPVSYNKVLEYKYNDINLRKL